MAIVKEWICLAHGEFDSADPVCPHGCRGDAMIERAFRTAPAIQSQGYRNINRTFDTLAAEAGVTNMNNSSGEGMCRADYATRKRLFDQSQSLGVGMKSGAVLDQMFKPTSEAAKAFAQGNVSALHKDETGRVNASGIPLGPIRPNLDGTKAYDGRSDGLPAGG